MRPRCRWRSGNHTVERAAELRGGGVRHSPVRIKPVGEARVCDKTIERGGALRGAPARLQQHRHSVVPRGCVLLNTGGQPLRDDRAESPLGVLVSRSRWALAERCLMRRRGHAGHDEPASRDAAGNCVQRAKFRRPRVLRAVTRDVGMIGRPCSSRGRAIKSGKD